MNINYAQSWYPADPEAQAGAQAQLEFSLRPVFLMIFQMLFFPRQKTFLRWLSDPIFGETGDYSQETKSIFGNLTRLDNFNHWKLPEFSDEEKKMNMKTADFFGLNFYNGNLFIGFDKTGIIRSAIDTYLEINGQERILDARKSPQFLVEA